MVPIIFRDVAFDKYMIDKECNIYKDGRILDISSIIYHSTNGYDFVLLEQKHLQNEKPKMKLYRLDFVMISAFNPGLQNRWKYFKVVHLDGDNHNCKLNNLSVEEDIEEWRPIEHNRVKLGQYIVSSHGNVMTLYDRYGRYDKRPMHTHLTRNGYWQFSMLDREGFVKHFRVHTIVAYAFHDGASHIGEDVNHIDGDKNNNHYSNLEYITRSSNIIHAIAIGLNKSKGETHHHAIVTEDDVNYICETLVKTGGNIKDTLIAYNDTHDKKILNSTIEHIKYKDTWRHVSDKYFNRDSFK